MNQSFDINVLREEARTRWLKPSEVYYILQNHERFPITHEAPKKPPSGSLFLYNRRVNRYFRRDGHTWRRKKDGRTVGEAHERLKVGNVDALSCYYAHGEQNPCFQRRCFWMLEPAYEHIVLVQYREVAEGRYYSSQLSNGPPESLSSLGYPNVIYGNQYLSSASGTSEGSESHQSYSNLSSVTEVSSYSGNKEYNRDGSSLLSIPEVGQTCLEQTTEVYDTDNGNSKNKSGLNVALKKIAEQLSLGDDDNDDYIYSNQAQHLGFATDTDAAGGNQVKQMQPEGTKEGLCRNVAPSWEDVLHSSSGLPTPSIYQARARLNQERRKPYVTLESASTEELGVTTDRLLIKRKRRVLAKEAKGKRVVENVRRSKFTEVGKQHFTFHKDVNAWIDIKKQYEGGHTCIQQIVHKLVGRKDIKQMIMKKILLDRNGGSNCTVICIDAGSGHGKTSLLHALYNDQLLTDTFDKSIWIQLSDEFDMVMLFRKIVEVSMNDHCSTANLSCLQEMVKEEIAEKKLLLFLDDADIEDQQFWSTVLEALNAGAKGSAVIMATRSSTVSTFRNLATHSYSLDPLSKENNLMIFQQYSVVGTDILSNPDLLMVAQRFISRFGSNPLNLKAIGGLLCHAESISLEMDDFDESVMPLQLCHDVLPIHLKKCLAFCSLFPEGYIFDKHHMVLRWISHGSVRPAEGCELEDVGVEYFNELLCRCFFQYSPVHSNKDDKFVIPKLMYKVVESVNRDKYFKSEDPTSSIPESILHLSLVSSQFQTVELISKTQGLNDLQTFMVVQPECQPYKISFPTLKLVGLDDFFLKFTSLETLDLSHTDTEELPGSIVGLRNLQYLSVNNTSIRTLPSQLCRLSNLQTLEAKDCRFLTELPGDTKKLLKLHHLDLTKELGYVHLPHGIGQLTELRTLPVFHANEDSSRCSISELGNLHSLRGCLRLSGLESVETGSKAQEANLKGKHHLKDLTLQWHDGGVDIDDEDEDAENVAEQVLESLQPHTNLQELAIRGYEGSVFPAWMQDSSSLPNLVSLTLDSCCNCTQFPAIAQLPSLKFLSIRKMYDVQRLTNNIHGATKFPSLELLNLWEMYGLEELFESSDGDCPRLRKVCISRCPSLKRLPCTPSLTELVLHCGQQLPAIPELVSLVSLKIEGFHALRSIKLPAAAALKKLEITSCKELLSVDGLSAMTTVLQRLKVAGCPKLVLPRTDHLTA